MSQPKTRQLELTFTRNGGAELSEGDDIIWASDDDDDFRDEFADEFLGEKDTERVIDYLCDSSEISDDEAESVEVFEEAFDGQDLTPEQD